MGWWGGVEAGAGELMAGAFEGMAWEACSTHRLDHEARLRLDRYAV